MKEKNEFDVLENTEQSVTDRLSAEFPPIDEDEKEKVFRMSEKKFNNLANGYSDEDEQSVSGVEIYKRPVWKKCLKEGLLEIFRYLLCLCRGDALNLCQTLRLLLHYLQLSAHRYYPSLRCPLPALKHQLIWKATKSRQKK